ncbi:MAG: glycoside hydrolase family 31 protein [Deltaproteobacteria bacterium]|nr:glycoside hydrolase family 31 protein [Deltaproteobacteria bacterium]
MRLLLAALTASAVVVVGGCASPAAAPDAAAGGAPDAIADVAVDAVPGDFPNWATWWDGAGDPKAGIVVLKAQNAAALGLGEPSIFQLAIDGAAKTMELQRTGESAPRVRFDLGRWQLGRVEAYDDKVNYNPSNLATAPPDGVQWCAVDAIDHIENPHPMGEQNQAGAFFRVKASAEGKPCPDYLLFVRAQHGIGFQVVFRPLNLYTAGEFSADKGERPVVYVRQVIEAPADEGYYGIGEMFDTPQHRGKVRALQLEADFNLDGSSNEGHVRIPLLVGTRGWGWFGQTFRAGVADVAASDPARIALTVQTSELVAWILAADQAIDVTSRYWKLTGRPLLPARWAVGGLLWRNENKDQAEVLQDAADLRKHDLALSGMWIDRPYDVAVNDFGFDPALYPNPKAMIDALRADGLRLGVWSTPYFDPGYAGKQKSKHFDKAKQNGWFVNGVGMWATVLKWGPPVDFTNQAARAFFQSLVKQYTDLGIEGFKLDYGEDIVLGIGPARLPWNFADGSDERTMHQGYQHGYHEAYASQLPKPAGRAAKTGGGWLLCRKSAWGDQVNASLIWPGDLCAGWVKHGECTTDGQCHAGGLPASVAAAISLPTAGFPLFGADTGGYRHGRAPKQLFLRWLQHTALTGVLQIGGGSDHNPWISNKVNNKLAPGDPFDEETLALSRELIRLHARLFPLLWTEMAKTQGDDPRGVGPVRALGLAYPKLSGDAGLRAREADQWLLGDHLLVAPVLTPGLEREVWFPPGVWVDWIDATVHDGGSTGKTESIAAPLAKLPLYVRAGQLVPLLRPTIDTLAPATTPGVESFANDPGVLWLRAAVTGPMVGPRSVQLYDGTAAELSYTGKVLGLQWSQSGAEFAKGAVFEVTGLGEPAAVSAGGVSVAPLATAEAVAAAPSACWHYDPASKRLSVRAVLGATVVTLK